MSTLFIGDLHLSVEHPEITQNFFRFLQQEATQAESLYILGDLFDKWIGDDDPHPLHREVAAGLSALKKKGIPCYFIHGNRDFLIGQAFADESGLILLPEYKIIQLYHYNILILHGDTLCTKDNHYQLFRKTVRHPFIQRLFLSLPLCLRLHIAKKLRHRSGEKNKKKWQEIMDVDPQAVINMIEHYQVNWMIHGHTHRPAIHRIELPQTPLSRSVKTAQRAVLGAWHREGSMIRVTSDAIKLIAFPFQEPDVGTT